MFSNLMNAIIFSSDELEMLKNLQAVFGTRAATLPTTIFQKERDRLNVEFCWKSAQLEGNTYNLIEADVLLSENTPAKGKTMDEAMTLINHKKALDQIYDRKLSLTPLRTSEIENIHCMLAGTIYKTSDGGVQNPEYIDMVCDVVNHRNFVFEKSLLALALISNIEPLDVLSKQVARIVGNGILIDNRYCPLSYRNLNSGKYQHAMVTFDENNVLTPFKKVFIEQFAFSVNNYFR